MVRKWIYRAAVCILPLAMLAACGDGSEAAMDEKTLNTLEMVAMDDDTSPEEGPGEELADEISLQYLTGDLTPEGQAQVLEAMTDLQRNLEIPEYLGEGIHLVSDAACMRAAGIMCCRGAGRCCSLCRWDWTWRARYLSMCSIRARRERCWC